MAHSADDDDYLIALLLGANGFAAAARIFSGSATLVPPNFCTIKLIMAGLDRFSVVEVTIAGLFCGS